MSKQEVRDSLSTVVGDLSLTTRENQIGSLFCDVQSDENFSFEVSKSKRVTLDNLDGFVGCLQLGVGIRGFKGIGDVSLVFEKDFQDSFKGWIDSR